MSLRKWLFQGVREMEGPHEQENQTSSAFVVESDVFDRS